MERSLNLKLDSFYDTPLYTAFLSVIVSVNIADCNCPLMAFALS